MKKTLILCVFGALGSTGLFAQAGAGSGAVTGTVLEAAGDGLPDTTVVLTNKALGLRRVMTTTDDGLFTAPALNPAEGYRLKVTRKDFVDWESSEFEVSTGQTVNFRITLKKGNESADDAAVPAPQIREVKTGADKLLTEAEVDGLPAGRLEALVQTAPTVSGDTASGRTVFTAQPFSNAFLTDGIATTNSYYQARPELAAQLPLDSVRELQVLSAGYPSEFGGAMGGVVNAATRSGSEGFHGSAYEHFANSGLGTAGRYTLGQTLLQRQDQFGAAVGGPIRPGKIFFFTNAEVWDGRANGLNRITSPLLADPSGMSIAASNCKATAAQCASAIKFLQGQMNVPVALSGRTVTGLAKVDYRRSDRNQFTVEGNVMNGRSPNDGPIGQVAANGGLLGMIDSTRQVRYGKVGWTSAPSPNSVNEMRFGLFQDRLSDPATQANLSTGNIGITVAGVTVGNPRPDPESLSEQRYQFVDNLTATTNTHTFRLGADLWRSRDTIDKMNAAGLYVYPSLTTFAQDFSGGGRDYTNFFQEFGNPLRKLATRQYNLYAMDTWRPVPRVTIMAGVRWERQRRPQPTMANTTYYETDSISSANIDFAPRISAAFLADDKTVLRVSYAWFYAPLPGQVLDSLFLGNGVYQTSIQVAPNQSGAPAFPNVLSSAGIPAGTTNLMWATNKLRDPHTEQLSLALEKTLTRDTTLTISGIRSRGYKLWTLNDANLIDPSVSKTYAIDNAAGQQTGAYTTPMFTGKNDPGNAHIYNLLNTGFSWYDAAVVELRKRMSHGLSAQASYTWSHAIDDVGGPTVAGFLPLNLYNNDITGDKANSPVDQRHRAVIDWTWQPVVVQSGSPVLRHVLNGWAVSGIATMASGHPVTPLVMVSGQQFSGITMPYTNSLNGSGGWARVPFESIGSLMTGTQYNLDARLSRTVDFSERVKGVLMFEAFNAFNTQYDTSLNTVGWTATPTAPPAGAVSGPTTGILRPVSGVGTGNASNAARQCQVAFRVTF